MVFCLKDTLGQASGVFKLKCFEYNQQSLKETIMYLFIATLSSGSSYGVWASNLASAKKQLSEVDFDRDVIIHVHQATF